MSEATSPAPRRTPRIRIESDGTVRSGGSTRVLVDGVDLSRFITDVTWQIGARQDRRHATATVEFLDGVELRTSAMPSAETALVLKELKPEILRRQAAFLTRDGALRVVCTDSESPDGVLPVCTSPDHPADDRERQWGVYDCCDHDAIEMHHEKAAAFYVDALAMLPALLDERDRRRERDRQDREDFAWHELHYAMLPDPFGPEPVSLGYQLFHPEQCGRLPRGAACWGDRDPFRHWWPTEQGVYRIRPVEWMTGGPTGEDPDVQVSMEIQARDGNGWTDWHGPTAGDEPDPERERLVHDDPALAEQIREGIAEAEAGRTVYLGSFAEHLEDDGSDL